MKKKDISLETSEICGKKMKKMRQGLKFFELALKNVANLENKCSMYNTSV